MKRLIIVGAGLSGLAAAYHARDLAEVTVLEASSRPGGVIGSTHRDGYVLEGAADSILRSKPWALELARELGLEDQVVSTSGRGGAMVLKEERLLPIPEGFHLMAPGRILPFLFSPVISLSGKLRMALDLVLPRLGLEDPSLSQFVVHRLGREAYERLAQPLVGGIYGADPERLSLAATMPEFLEIERVHGSLIRGMLRGAAARKGDAGARYSMFFNFRGGSQTLIDSLVQQVGERLKLDSPVSSLKRQGEVWQVQTPHSTLQAETVVLALPAHGQASLISPWDPPLAQALECIAYSNAVTVNLAYDQRQLGRKPKGFGFVVPRVENSYLLACTYSSQKWPGRAPPGKVLLRGYLGGADCPEVLDWSDEELSATVHEELEHLLGIDGTPELTLVSRYERAMPGYHVGHGEVVKRVHEALKRWPGLALAGNGLSGVGIPDCVRTARLAVEGLRLQRSVA